MGLSVNSLKIRYLQCLFLDTKKVDRHCIRVRKLKLYVNDKAAFIDRYTLILFSALLSTSFLSNSEALPSRLTIIVIY